MKKKVILMLAFCININYICFTQTPAEGRAKKIEEFQRSYLTEELSLTPEESAKLFPVYDEYRDELKKIKKDRGTDELEYAEQVLDVRKKYKAEFKEILGTDERVNKIFTLEKNFKKLLQDELDKRKKDQQSLSVINNYFTLLQNRCFS